MKTTDVVLAILVATLWGSAFVATEFALQSFTAPQLVAIRFAIAAIPVLFIARPKVSWPLLVTIGMTLFAGQFLLLFFGFVLGMPPGLASITAQTQAFFTIILAAIVLGDRPTARQLLGIAVSTTGLALVAFSTDEHLTHAGLALTLAGALSWAIGNIALKQLRDVDMFPLMVWLSLIPPIPALILSTFLDGPGAILSSVANASWPSSLSALYLGTFATLLAYALWGKLLRDYPTATVAPFALLAPCTGLLGSMLIFDEIVTPIRAIGMSLILGGLAFTVIRRRVAGAEKRAT